MTVTAQRAQLTITPPPKKMSVIDTDVHPTVTEAAVVSRLPEKWRRYVSEYGIQHGGRWPGGERLRQRAFTARLDSEPPGGGIPGSSPDFAREQLLDRYDFGAAILNGLPFRTGISGFGRQPTELSAAYCRAYNDAIRDEWFAHDERWYASMTVPYELPEAAVAEIERRKSDPVYGDRWVQILLAPNNVRPPGHPSYWPIYEACEHYGIAVGFHVVGLGRITPSGTPNYYFEEHCDFGAFNFPIVTSMIFEGVFERFPRLNVAMVELAWTWAVPLAWRMDHAFRVMGGEVPHLKRLPSEYLRDHFWYTTQPIEEPENPRWIGRVFEHFYESGMGDKLMYSSDYPHWDFDEPSVLPKHALTDEQLGGVLGGNASRLYGIGLLPNRGVTLRGPARAGTSEPSGG